MHRHRCRNEKARVCEPYKCRLWIRPGLFLNGFFSIRNTVCWSFLRVHYAGYVYPAAFARLSPKVRGRVVAKVAKPLRISTEFSRELAWRFHPLPTLPSARLITRSDGLLEGSLKTGSTGNTPQRKEHLITGLLRTRRHAHHINALTCCALRF